MNARNQTRKLAFEQCEGREMMAGNVSAAMYGGELVIQGDNQSNSIEITEITNYAVEIKATNGTTINGTNVAYFFNPSDKINAYMNGGDDVLTLASTAGRNPTGFVNAYIDMGSGRDQLGFWGTQNVNTTVVMGADWENDADYLDIGRNPFLANSPSANFWGNLDIRTGGGDDYIALREYTNVYGNTRINMGEGNDSLRIDRMYAARDFYANLGNGNNQVNAGGLTARGYTVFDAGTGYDIYLGSPNHVRRGFELFYR